MSTTAKFLPLPGHPSACPCDECSRFNGDDAVIGDALAALDAAMVEVCRLEREAVERFELERAERAARLSPDHQGDAGVVDCDECYGEHPATYSHEGSFGEGHVYAVVCPVDDLTDYYTAERVK